MRLWNHLWAVVLVSFSIGVFLIGGGAYYWAWQEQASRERKRHWNEQLTGVKLPPPPQEEEARQWNRDLLTGAAVGGVIWVLGVVFVFGRVWLDSRSGTPGQQGQSLDEAPSDDPNEAADRPRD